MSPVATTGVQSTVLSISDSLPVGTHASSITGLNFTNFLCILLEDVIQSSNGGTVICSELSVHVADVIFSHNRSYVGMMLLQQLHCNVVYATALAVSCSRQCRLVYLTLLFSNSVIL